MKLKFANALSLALIMAMLFTSIGLASAVDVAVVDVTAPTGSVTLTPGTSGPIVINLTVTGKQDGTATFQVNTTWTLSGGVFSGSNPQTFTVPAGDYTGGTSWTNSTTGIVTVASGESTEIRTLAVSAFNITNSNQQGAKLADGADSSYQVTVNTPAGKSNQTITFAALANKTYGDADFSVSASASSGLPVSFTASGDCSVSGNTVHTTGAGSCTITAHQVGDSSYNAAPDVSQSFNIARANAAIVVNGYSVIYDGAAHTATGTATGVFSESLSGLDLSATTHTNSGSYTDSWTFTDVTGNYNNASGTVNDSIGQASSTTVVSGGGTFTYDGLAHGATVSVTGAGGLTLSPAPVYSGSCSGAPVNVAETPCTASYTYPGDANHTASTGSAVINITKANANISVLPYDVTYDSFAHTATGTATGVNGEALSSLLDLTGTTHTNAGTYNGDTWSFAGNDNYNATSGSVDDNLDKADAACTITGYSVTYNGTEHIATGSCTGVGSDGTLSGLDLNGTKHTDAGSYTDSWTFTDVTGNYDDQSSTVNDEIAKAPVTATAGSGSSIYDGATHSPSGCLVSGDYTGDLSCANSPASVGPNAGTTTITPVISGTGLDNFDIAEVNGSYTINQAPSTTTVTCGAGPFVYTGSPITPCSASVTGAGGLSQSLTVNYSNNTNVGTATASASYAGDVNHTVSSDSKTFQILAWTLKGFYQPVDMYGVLNTVKGGSTVPLKFEVLAGSTELMDTAIVSSRVKEVTCNATTEDTIEVLATGGTSLRYDPTGIGQFIFNWQTPKLPGHCYTVTLTMQDGSSLSALFKLK